MTVTTPALSRLAWTLFEPIHAVVYFAPESAEAYKAAGLRGGWMGYFASRSAAMGEVTAEVVIAVFHNFQPAMVQRAIPDAWHFSTRQRVLAARYDAIDRALRRLWGDAAESADIIEAADLALEAARHLRADGRPLYSGHASLDVPAPGHLALWHACTLLREHRFDGHVAALTAHDVRGDEALVLAVAGGRGLDGPELRRFRGWTDEEWADAEGRLRRRGAIDENSALTADGKALVVAVEDTTDRLAAAPWAALAEPRRERLFTLLRDATARLDGPGALMYPNPVGVTRPG